ncbi:hypothetical protein JW935_14005 [candidate division KSB1 bacterium]|nr:hypothetical protein [candidate division KSB1 bacterium]
MKKTLNTITVTFCLFLVPNVFAEDFKLFVDKEYGYSIEYPSSWKAKIYRSGIVIADITSKDKKSGLQIRMTRSKNSVEEFIDLYVRSFEKDMRATLIEKTESRIGSFTGYKISFTAKRGRTVYFLKSYILPVRATSTFYIFQSGTPQKKREHIEPVLDDMAASFRLE